jgi:hypothetical protein
MHRFRSLSGGRLRTLRRTGNAPGATVEVCGPNTTYERKLYVLADRRPARLAGRTHLAGEPVEYRTELGLSALHRREAWILEWASPWLLHRRATRCCPFRRLWRNLRPRQTWSRSATCDGISCSNAPSISCPDARGVIGLCRRGAHRCRGPGAIRSVGQAARHSCGGPTPSRRCDARCRGRPAVLVAARVLKVPDGLPPPAVQVGITYQSWSAHDHS